MQKIAFRMEKENGDGCVARFLCQILKTAGYRVACLIAGGEEREYLLIQGRPISRKQWEVLGEETASAGIMDKLKLLETQKPQLLLWIGTAAVQEEVLKKETGWIRIAVQDVSSRIGKVWHGVRKQRFDYEELPSTKLKEVELNMPGVWQVENAATALSLLLNPAIQERGIRVTEQQIRRGIARTVCEGCLQVQGNRPMLILDRGANGEAARLLWESVERIVRNRPVITILGLKRTAIQETEELLRTLCPPAQTVLTMSVTGGYRAYELAEQVKEFQPNVTAVDSPEEALEIARLFAGAGQTNDAGMPVILIVCPRELQEKIRKIYF